MESLIEYVVNTLEMPRFTGLVLLLFIFSIKISKRYFDQTIKEKDSKIRQFIDELKIIDITNTFLVEQVFIERYQLILNYDQIMYFLKSERPSWNLFLYINSKSYFTFKNSESKIVLHPIKTDKYLRIKGVFLAFGYYVFALSGASLIMLVTRLYIDNLSVFVSLYFMIISLFLFAFICVHSQVKTDNARQLIVSIDCEAHNKSL